MTEITARCQGCQSTLTMPLPDALGAPDGTMRSADQIALEDLRAGMGEFLQEFTCPHCGHTGFEIIGERVSTRQTIPVYATYTMHLERYIEVEADTMEEAQEKAKAMARGGIIQRPRYTEGLDDWTEIADPHARAHFTIDHEAI
jgi:hypothetical protein